MVLSINMIKLCCITPTMLYLKYKIALVVRAVGPGGDVGGLVILPCVCLISVCSLPQRAGPVTEQGPWEGPSEGHCDNMMMTLSAHISLAVNKRLQADWSGYTTGSSILSAEHAGPDRVDLATWDYTGNRPYQFWVTQLAGCDIRPESSLHRPVISLRLERLWKARKMAMKSPPGVSALQ